MSGTNILMDRKVTELEMNLSRLNIFTHQIKMSYLLIPI